MNKKEFKKWFILLIVIYLFSAIPPLSQAAGIFNTKHNLSSLAPTTNIKALNETQVCIFCHTPHNAKPAYPLWNHELSAVVNYTNYWSETLKSYPSEAEAPPIDGFSQLCLSCHDGTIAIGATITKGEIPMEPNPSLVGGRLATSAAGYIGTDLSGGHPISIIFDGTLAGLRNAETSLCQLNWPISDPYVKLYPTQGGYGVQCTSCHNPHTNRSTYTDPSTGQLWPPFWQKENYDAVCLVCHVNCTHTWPW